MTTPENNLTTRSPNLRLLKFLYILTISIILSVIAIELFFVINRRMSVRLIDEYKIGKNNVYSARLVTEAFSDSLWEVKWDKYKANAVLEKTVGDNKYIVKTNSHGFRSREFITEKPKGVYRIICIGGSTTVQGNTNDATYPAILEKILKNKYPGLEIEVLNFGIGRTESGYWGDRLDELFKYQPDMIIQYNAVNDICWRYFPMQNNNCTNRFSHLLRRFMNHSFLLQKILPLNESFFDNCVGQTFENFRTIASEAESRGVRYIVGSFAAPDYDRATDIFRQYLDYNIQSSWGDGINLKYYLPYQKLLGRYNRLLASYTAKHNLRMVPVDRSLTDPDLFIDICHMTPDGIETLAGIFAEGISDVLEKISSRDWNR